MFPGTEKRVYHDQFFQAQNLVVNALDNVEARRYVDRYCVYITSSLFDSPGGSHKLSPTLTKKQLTCQKDPHRTDGQTKLVLF